jgi:predicted metal-binding membrane protein
MAEHLFARQDAAARAVALALPLAVAVACWVLSARQMAGMDMGTRTSLGSLRFFAAAWAAMMAAMMLPGAVPALVRQLSADSRWLSVPMFLASYLAVWALLGGAVYALYRPHGSTAAGVIVIAAGLYEVTPLKRHYRQRCQERVRSGLQFGYCCVGSSLGLMLVLLAVGVMNIAWMVVVAIVVLVQKVLPPKAALDVPVALAIIALGIGVVAF